jgi:hypothetical protein
MARCKNTEMLMGAIKKAGGGKVQTSADTARKLATEMGGMKKGGRPQTSADTARNLATEMGGMKKGSKPKSGLAVMIAIGEVKKPAKKAVGGAGKTRKGMAPEKFAKGGAGKVRKGMMSPDGNMLQPVKPKSGLGSSY